MAAMASTLAAGTTLASAAPAAVEDGADTFNVAAGTTVMGTNSGVVTISASFPGAGTTITITCTLSNHRQDGDHPQDRHRPAGLR
jgi:hypothetical protein